MEKSTVYFTDFRCPVGTSQLDKLKKLCIAAGIKDIDMEGKHGIMVYEIELASGWREYKVKVDAATGKVLTSRFEGIAWFD